MATPGDGEQSRTVDEETQKPEKDSEVVFDENHVEACVTNGQWDELEKYLSGFVKIDQEDLSVLIFFEIRKQKFLEALDRKDISKAVEILRRDLKFFADYNPEIFQEITMLLTLEDIRENRKLSTYGDACSARARLLQALKQKSTNYSFFRRKPEFGNSDNSKLTAPMDQSYGNNTMASPLAGQVGSYAPISAPPPSEMPTMPTPNRNPTASFSIPDPLRSCNTTISAPAPPVMRTMPILDWNLIGSPYPIPNFLRSSNTIPAPVPPVMPMMSIPNRNFTASASSKLNPLTCFNTTIPAPARPRINVRALMPGPSSVPCQAVSTQPFEQKTPAVEVPERPLKRQRVAGTMETVNNLPNNFLPDMHPNALPQTPVVNFYQDSQVQSLDFHPVQQTLLLVGTANGDISIWEMGETEWLVHHPFEIWHFGACSLSVQTSFANDPTASVNRVIWSPDGAFFGVAFSKHLVHIYSYNGDVLTKYIEIDAHFGNVYDILFPHQSEQFCVITCGEDNAIRMWMALADDRLSQVYNFVGHEAPVYSLCPYDDGKQYLFSVDTNGKINAWIYGTKLFTCDACPSWGRMACSADGTRLFYCGTDSNGDSYLVEWDHKEGGDVKHNYRGLQRRSMGVVQFDTANNQILAAGDEFQVKFWTMDNVKQLSYSWAAGGLPCCPCIRFNKGGTLLAVSTLENGIIVLANAGGLQLLRSREKCPLTSRPIDVVDYGLATVTHDEGVEGSPGFRSFDGQSPGFSSFDGHSPGFGSFDEQSPDFGSSDPQSPGVSSGTSVEQSSC